MYAGAGAAPLMAAGATWNGLAVELSTTASSVESVIMQLTTEQWLGPASMSMVVAAQPYLAWLTYTAESAAHAAAQAMASAAAFEAAFAMTVPPAEVAANRALLAALVATNVLGQNTPAIMATEAHYGEMWAQDALAMYGYAASSAAAGRLNPLITPSQTANMAGLAGQAAAVSHAAAASTVQQVGLGSLISNLPNAVMGFASPLTSAADAAGLGGIIQDIEELLGITFVQNAINGAVNTTAWFVMATIPNAVFLGHAFAALNPATVTAAADAVPAAAAAAGLAHTVTPVGVGGASLTASLGEASSVGGLSVPAGWSTAAPAMTFWYHGTGGLGLGGPRGSRASRRNCRVWRGFLGRPKEPVPMPGLGTGSSPSSCPNRSSSDWPVAHRPGRPAMSRTATRQAWPVRQPTVGPQPTPPGPSIKPPEPWRRSRPRRAR
ncbi:PPE family protein [Mycobacterium tuberculosis RGTB327]|nr:PPE family protein [Mycobacterium tuberculosis RGTB327]